MQRLLKHKNIILLTLLSLLIPNLTRAGLTDIITSALAKVFSLVVFGINYIIGFIGGVFFTLGGLLLQMGLTLNARLILSPIVKTGWLITRDFANLGFVIAIIVIAFATMLRVESYGMKKMLTNLIVIALLVNFSLTIAGVLIDASGVISNFFISRVAPTSVAGISSFTENLAGAFQLQRLQDVQDIGELPEFNGWADFGASMLGLIASVFFVAIFTVLGASTMILLSIFVIIRYIALAVLLILMPLAWVFSIFPAFENFWRKWWGQFLQWLFFLPIVLFFLYLTILTTTNFQNDPNSIMRAAQSIENASGGWLAGFFLAIQNVFEVIAQMVVIIGLLIAGLIVGKKASGLGAGAAVNAAEGFKTWGLGKIKSAAKAPGKGIRAAGREIGRWAGQKVVHAGAKPEEGQPALAQRFANWMSTKPGLRGAGSALAGYLAKGKESVEEYQKKYLANISSEAVMGYSEWGPVAQAAKVIELAKRDQLDKFFAQNPKKVDKYIKAVQQMDVSKDLLNNRPDLAPKFNKKVEDVMSRMSPNDILNISKETWKMEQVLAEIEINKLKTLARKAKPDIKKIIEENLEKKLNELRLKTSLQPHEKVMLAKLTKIEHFIKNNPLWQ